VLNSCQRPKCSRYPFGVGTSSGLGGNTHDRSNVLYLPWPTGDPAHDCRLVDDELPDQLDESEGPFTRLWINHDESSQELGYFRAIQTPDGRITLWPGEFEISLGGEPPSSSGGIEEDDPADVD
jgi:hypothetical protein